MPEVNPPHNHVGEYSLLGGEKSFCDEKNSYKMKKKKKLENEIMTFLAKISSNFE